MFIPYPNRDPLFDQPQYALVPDPVPEKPEQPVMFHGIEELTDVQIQHPVYLSRHNRRMQGIQCVMLTSSRSESIGKPQKISLVDLVQHRHHRLLYDFVLQTHNAQRSF